MKLAMKITKWAVAGLLFSFSLSSAQNFATTVSGLKPISQGGDQLLRINMRKLTQAAVLAGGTARSNHEKALVAELAKGHDVNIKLFLIRELNLIASETATVTALTAYLNDANLAGSSIEALLSMAIEAFSKDNGVLYNAVRAAVRSKLTGAAGANRIALLRAGGSLSDYNLVDIFIAEAASLDTTTKWIALRGLAVTGDPKAQSILAAALSVSSSYYFSLAVQYNLMYARRLAARGDKATAGAITQAILNNADAKSCRAYGEAGAINVSEVPTIARADAWFLPVTVSVAKKGSLSNTFSVYGLAQMKRLRILISAKGTQEIRVSNLLGKKVWSNSSQSKEHVINGLAKGRYLVEVQLDGKKQPSQLISLY